MHGSLVGSTSGSELFQKKFLPSVEERWDKEEGLKGVIIWQARGQDDTLGVGSSFLKSNQVSTTAKP